MDANGNPLSGGKLYVYLAGSSTPATTYQDNGGSVQNANPIVLNSNGYPASGGSVVSIWLTEGQAYLFELETSADVPIWSRDDIEAINDVSVSQDQWVTGPAPTFVGTTSFTLAGDQTSTFHVGRRVKTTNSGGTIYSTISASAFAALTTVTVVNDSGVLDSGLSAVSYGLLSATNPSTPLLTDAYPIASGSADKTKKLRVEVDGFTTATTRVMTPPDQDSGIGLLLSTKQATTSGTTKDFTIPAWAKIITVMFNGVSLDGTEELIIQLGDAGGVEDTGYVGACETGSGSATVNFSSGFLMQTTGAAAAVSHGQARLVLLDSAAFTWSMVGMLHRSDSAATGWNCAGTKSTSAVATTLRITSTNTPDDFDAGEVNVLFE